VLARVGSVQFDAAEEVGRQLGLDGGDLPPLPLGPRDRTLAYADGKLEESDLSLQVYSIAGASRRQLGKLCKQAYDAGRRSARDDKNLSTEELRNQVAAMLNVDLAEEQAMLQAEPVPQGPRRQRPCAPLADPEPDPHEQRAQYPAVFGEPLTGAHVTLQPQYRRKPAYRVRADGTAAMHFAERPDEEARTWARCFARDARKCIIRSHLHRCGPTCWKHKTNDDAPQHCKVCRLGFWHEYETAVYSHPSRKRPAVSFVWRRLRKGKDLVLPEDAKVQYACGPLGKGQWNPPGERLDLDDVPAEGYGPWPHRCNQYGRAGRVDVVRYHPYHGSTNPVGQVLGRQHQTCKAYQPKVSQ
jgi:hypothetical protein